APAPSAIRRRLRGAGAELSGAPRDECCSWRVLSRTVISAAVSDWKWLGLMSRAWRRASGARVGGSSSTRGIRAPSTRIGITRTFLVGRLDLAAHEVARPVEATSSVLVGHRDPARPDERQQDVAGGDRGGDGRGEVVAEGDRVDVLEHRASAEPLGEPV